MPFHAPDLSEHGPVPFWFWNDELEEPELRRQIRLMRQGGLRNFIIHARWGLKTPYLSALWWRQVKAAVDEAKRQGLRVWLYDEYNYPSGIAGFKLTRQARFRERFLATASLRVAGGRTAQLQLPAGVPEAVFAHRLGPQGIELAGAVDLKASIRGGKARFSAPAGSAWLLSAFCRQVEPFKGSGKYSVNYLAPEPTREFIRLTHEAYKEHLGEDLGSVSPCFFLDEPRFNNALPWDERLPLWFEQRRGYSLPSRLALLLHASAEAAAFRRDYHSLLSELYCEHFFKPVAAWCKKHKVELTGHLMAEETLAGAARFSADGMAPYEHFSLPGCDHLGRGIGGLTPKIASSAAWAQGAKRVSCETFAGCGQDFKVEHMNLITHWLFAQGVNLIVPHAFFYAMRTQRQKGDWPPSMFYQWAHWPQYPRYAERVARLAGELSGGEQAADLALYYPMGEFQSAYVPDPAYKTGYFKQGPAIQGPGALALEAWFQDLGQALRNRQHDFHVLPVERFGKLKGHRVLLLPPQAQLDAKAQRRVAAFKRAGGRVLQGSAAVILRGLKRALPTPDIALRGPGVEGRLKEWDTRIHDPYLHPELDRILREDRGGVSTLHVRKAGEELYFFANNSAKPRRFQARLRVRGARGELRWPGSGRVEAVRLRRRGAVGALDLAIPPFEAALLSVPR
jgi:hypothetical protein